MRIGLDVAITRGGASGPPAPPPGPTYADWVTQAAVLAPTDATGVDQAEVGTYRRTLSTPSGTMRGTTFNNAQGADLGFTAWSRAIQHAFPDQTSHDENVAQGRVVVAVVASTGPQTATWFGVNRNGYLSGSSTTDGNGIIITAFYYWNAATGQVEKFNPSVNGPVTVHTW